MFQQWRRVMTDRAKELLERAFESLKNRTLITENERKLEKEISYYLLSTPEATQDEGWQLREVYFHADGEPGMHRKPAPRRDFEPLTEEELIECWGIPYSLSTEELRRFARAVEKAALEKNK